MSRPTRIRLERRKGFRLQAVSLALNGMPAMKVDRSTPFGNPFPVDGPGMSFLAVGLGYFGDRSGRLAASLALFRAWMTREPVVPGPFLQKADRVDSKGVPLTADVQGLSLGVAAMLGAAADPGAPPDLATLEGKNIACWCPIGSRCHGDVILELLKEGKSDGRSVSD